MADPFDPNPDSDFAQPIKRQIGTIDLTPKWQGILPLLLTALEIGTDQGKQIAREELFRMAKAADAANGK